MSIATMVAPVGVEAIIEITIPVTEQKTEIIAEQKTTDRKLLNTRMAESDGKIIRADVSRDPTRFIARTMITDVIMAIIRLYALALVPVA